MSSSRLSRALASAACNNRVPFRRRAGPALVPRLRIELRPVRRPVPDRQVAHPPLPLLGIPSDPGLQQQLHRLLGRDEPPRLAHLLPSGSLPRGAADGHELSSRLAQLRLGPRRVWRLGRLGGTPEGRVLLLGLLVFAWNIASDIWLFAVVGRAVFDVVSIARDPCTFDRRRVPVDSP